MKTRTATGTVLIGLLLSACSQAGSSRDTPTSAPVPVMSPSTTSSPVAADDASDPSGVFVATTTITTPTPPPAVVDLDADQLTNALDELDRSINDLDRSLNDKEGDPLNE